MKKYSIIIGISALLLAFIMPVECMGGLQEEASYLDYLQDSLREKDCQVGMAFLGYIGEDALAQDILDYTRQNDYPEIYPFYKMVQL
ncbi:MULTISPECIES: hypothetical protein [unclassified Ruminococcus]|uniref:hypothetical protein n=1 Tax=unclassified Ruminococcus TaxID=2608920 RepID=UPI00319E06E8